MSPTPPTAASAAAPADDGGQLVWLYEKQKKVYARAVSGWFTNWRWALVWATQLVFYGLPWLSWNGRPAVLFDLDGTVLDTVELIMAFEEEFKDEIKGEIPESDAEKLQTVGQVIDYIKAKAGAA